VNTKVLAMRGASHTGDVTQDAARLMHFIHTRPAKKCVEWMAQGLTAGDMDVAYYLALWKHLGALDKFSQTAMRRIVGTEIDLRNILWMYRLKRFYGVAGDATFGYLIPVGKRLDKETVARMASCKDANGLIHMLAHGVYSNIFGDFSHGESRLFHAVNQAYQREVRQNPDTVAMVCGYLYKRSGWRHDYHNEIHNHNRAYRQP